MKAGHRIETQPAREECSYSPLSERAMKAGHRIETVAHHDTISSGRRGARDEGGSPH